MTEGVTVTFDGQSTASGAPCFLRVTFLDQPYAHIVEPWDREMINCEITVDAGAFTGQYATAIWGYELVRIRAVLVALYKEVAQEAETSIDLMERAFDMKLVLTSLGHLTMEIVARGDPGMGPELHFSMEADQSYLPLWIKQLDGVLAAFPSEVPINLSDPLRYRGPERVR